MEGLRIDRLPEGGFVLSHEGMTLFACSRIDEALAFILKKLDPRSECTKCNGDNLGPGGKYCGHDECPCRPAPDKQAAKEAAKAWVRHPVKSIGL